MIKSLFLATSCFCLFGLAVSSYAQPTDQPNILFILVDDLGKEWISTYGAEGIETPHIDQLARTGLQFTNAYSTPQCTPSRITLFTGQYPYRHGWVNHWDVPRWGGGAHFDANENPSLGQTMRNAGYRTAAAGKWQVNDFRVQPEAMVQHGFDDYCMWTGYETGVPASAERYWDPYIHTQEGSGTYEGKFGEDVFSDFLIQFMQDHRQEPMFLYYAMCLTHTPFTSTPLEPNVTDKYDCHRAMVRYMDHTVGKLVQALDDLGLRENTIIIFTTDNGTVGSITGNLNGREVPGGKQQTTENGICAPFVVNCPGQVPTGKKTDALVDFSDMLPTLADLAGASLPSDTLDGVSLAPVILGETTDSPRDWIFSMGGGNYAELSEEGVENQYVFRDRVIRGQRYKLFVDTKRQPVKLVDLAADPEETHNLLDSRQAGVQRAYRKLWEAIEQMPSRDHDPRYRPLPSQAWDREVTVQTQVWKK